MVYEELYAKSIYEVFAESLGVSVETAALIIAIITIWSLIWKGLALWKAAKKNHTVWFIIILVLNTIGILEILYIYLFSEIKIDDGKKPVKKRNKTRKT